MKLLKKLSNLFSKNFFYRLRKGNIERDKEWNPDKSITLSFRGNELAGEVGEACNLLKKIERHRLGLVGNNSEDLDVLIEKLKEELGDIIICVDLIAMDLKIDTEDSVKNKFNKTSDKVGLQTKI